MIMSGKLYRSLFGKKNQARRERMAESFFSGNTKALSVDKARTNTFDDLAYSLAKYRTGLTSIGTVPGKQRSSVLTKSLANQRVLILHSQEMGYWGTERRKDFPRASH